MASEFGTLYYYSLLFKVVFALSMPHLVIYSGRCGRHNKTRTSDINAGVLMLPS